MFDAAPVPAPPEAAIVVTARALPDPAAEAAYAVELIDRRGLANAPSTQLDQVLKAVPGLQLFRRSDARSAHPTSQGVTLRALGGNASGRALLVLDGVPQADPFGSWVYWPAYDPASLASVRLIRGGGSVGYGPGALGGVIEMTSADDAGMSGELAVGSRQSAEARGVAGVLLGHGTLALSGRFARGDGFVPIVRESRGPADRRAPYREAAGRASWARVLSPSIDFRAGLAAFRDQRERGVDFTGNRSEGADAYVRLVGSGRWRWSAVGYSQWRELRSSFASVDDTRSQAQRVSLQNAVPSSGFGGSIEVRPPTGRRIELRAGVDARRVSGESRELFSYVASEPTRRRVAGGDSITAGAFSEATLFLGRLTLSGGGRLDHWEISDGKLIERVIATGESLRSDHFARRSGWLSTARAGAVVDLGHGVSARAAAYLGWRMPTLNELFRPFRAGADATAANPQLDPERLSGGEIGLRYKRGGASLSLTAFANRLTDAIANVTLAHGPGLFPGVGFVGPAGEYRQRQNLDAISVRGVEASGQLARGPWSLRLGGSLTNAEVHSSGASHMLDGLRPAQTPRLALTAGAGWRDRGREFSIELRHVGRQFEDDVNQRSLRAATTVAAFAAWPIGWSVTLVARGENLFDRRVEAGIDTDGVVERATPRTLWLSVRLQSKGTP